ncbi:hypothetical protein D9M72_600340 [compost metagenome]
MVASALRCLLVNLLLQVGQRHLQEKAGEVLPPGIVRGIPGLLRREGQAVGQQHGIGRLVQPAAQSRVLIQLSLLYPWLGVVPGNMQRFNEYAAVFEQHAITVGDPGR